MAEVWTEIKQVEAVAILSGDSVVPHDRRYYHVVQNFELVEIAGVRRIRRKRDQKLMAIDTEMTRVVRDVHVAIGHKGETKTHKKIQETYSNIPKSVVKQVIADCARCTEKSKKKCVRGVVVRPFLASALNDRGQIDLVDYQSLPDGEYRFIMHYKEHLTKFSFLRPLTHKKASEVAKELLPIFLTYGAPRVLQSDNGREFTATVIAELASLWPDLVLVNGRPRYPQSQGSVERANATMKDSLVAWMRDHNTSAWSTGLHLFSGG